MATTSDKKKKFFIPKVFAKKGKGVNGINSPISLGHRRTSTDNSNLAFNSFPDSLEKCLSESSSVRESLDFAEFSSPMCHPQNIQSLRMFVSTWNLGGKPPHSNLNLDEFLRVDDPSDIYVLGFQEIVPLNAGNVLVIEDDEPAAKWLTLIHQSLNKPQQKSAETESASSYAVRGFGPQISLRDISSVATFQKASSLRAVSRSFKPEFRRHMKACNCPNESERKNREFCFRCQAEENYSSGEEGPSFVSNQTFSANTSNYSLVASRQMVGIFVSVWAKNELVQQISHLRISCVGRGIMNYLGNKGCISVSMTLHSTSFCFICSHLNSGEKEGDELRRNSDVMEVLKNTQFPRICKNVNQRIPEKILGHDRIIWLGDLNYRIALSYSEARKLLEESDWELLFEKDQLKIEQEAGRVFKGWNEGKIHFPPTYKYSWDSDDYAGEVIKSRKKRRTPAWCDRILWFGDGIQQLSYFRAELKFSDHRPVCAMFKTDVEVQDSQRRKRSAMKVAVEELLPKSCSIDSYYTAVSDLS